MDTTPTPSPAPTEMQEIREQCAQLQQLVTSLLLIVIVISGTLSVFLLREWRFARAEVKSIEPLASQWITEDANSRAGVEDFIKKIAEYGRTHQDFAPIMNKYHLNDYLAKPASGSVTSAIPTAVPAKQ